MTDICSVIHHSDRRLFETQSEPSALCILCISYPTSAFLDDLDYLVNVFF